MATPIIAGPMAPITARTAIRNANIAALKQACPRGGERPPPEMLHLAVARGNMQALRWLLGCGAADRVDPNTGLSAFDLAMEKGNAQMAGTSAAGHTRHHRS